MNALVRPALKVLLASPRGFCAGVERAIQIVERAIAKYGAPVFVRHEIVHNVHVVDRLKSMGAVFVDQVEDCPADRPLVFSAHGVPKCVPAEADRRGVFYLDATCPLVSKVHIEAQRRHEEGLHVLLIGHAGHPEVIGTMGQLPPGAVSLIETVADARAFIPQDPERLGFVTQTTLSIDDAAEIVGVLQARFPSIEAPVKEDICYATTNRQEAIKRMASHCDRVLVVGSKSSSNSQRLVEVAVRAGAGDARLIDDASDIDWAWLRGAGVLGLTAGASAPEMLVKGVIEALKARFEVSLEEAEILREAVSFKLPRVLYE
jgi:4-hydroxy-3-methylbut-2-enyl diphosphate reductase